MQTATACISSCRKPFLASAVALILGSTVFAAAPPGTKAADQPITGSEPRYTRAYLMRPTQTKAIRISYRSHTGAYRAAIVLVPRRRHHRTRNLARYLMGHAGPLPPGTPVTKAQRMGAHVGDPRSGRGDPDFDRALKVMRQLWQATRGYFPGREMPVPRFAAGSGAYGAVGWANDQQGHPTPIGIKWDRGAARDLVSRDQTTRDVVLRELLHEWAHNFQRPATYASAPRHRGVQPAIEGGADAFAYAVAPGIARAIGRRYSRRGAIEAMRGEDYLSFTRGVTRRRGMDWILRGQFG
jgi:hypothetical protein